jgi:hypothetical protein
MSDEVDDAVDDGEGCPTPALHGLVVTHELPSTKRAREYVA